MTADPVRRRVRGRTHRIVASRYPTVGVFDDLTRDADELRAAFVLEALTNDRLAGAARRLAVLPDEEVVQGATASLVMAAFLHADPAGGRFTDGRLGAWYASFEIETAIAETVHHTERRLRLSEGGFPSSIQVRELIAAVDARLVDIRGDRPELHDPDRHAASQAFGIALRWPAQGRGENGIAFDSARRAGGSNVCLFRPSLVRLPVVQGDHYAYQWDAAGRVAVARLAAVEMGR